MAARLKVEGSRPRLDKQGLAGVTLHVETVVHVINMTG